MWILSTRRKSLMISQLLLLTELLNANETMHEELADQVDYEFGYSVEQPNIALVTHHWERRHGHTVMGGYSLLQPNGQIRIVEYHINGSLGFRARIKYRRPAGQFVGHLRFPYHYRKPIQLLEPVSLITPDLFIPKEIYPNLPATSI